MSSQVVSERRFTVHRPVRLCKRITPTKEALQSTYVQTSMFFGRTFERSTLERWSFNIFVDGLLSTSYLIIGTQHRRMKSIYMDTPYDPHLVETHNTTIVGRHLLHDLTPSHHHTLLSLKVIHHFWTRKTNHHTITPRVALSYVATGREPNLLGSEPPEQVPLNLVGTAYNNAYNT